jgi:hypothetical protein
MRRCGPVSASGLAGQVKLTDDPIPLLPRSSKIRRDRAAWFRRDAVK